MKTAWFVRAGVIVFALLLGGGYVYSRVTGKWLIPLPMGEDDPPATITGTPMEDNKQFLSGSKSALVVEPSVTVQPVSPDTKLLPGSKSLILADPNAPNTTTRIQTLPPNPPPSQPQLLPGSKSAAVVEPFPSYTGNGSPENPYRAVSPGQPNQAPQQSPTPQLLPGSKSDVIVPPQQQQSVSPPRSKNAAP